MLQDFKGTIKIKSLGPDRINNGPNIADHFTKSLCWVNNAWINVS